MKKCLCITACFFTLFCFVSCAKNEPRTKTFYTYFDTVISVYSYNRESEKQFEKNCNEIEKLLDRYNRLFDIYHEYSGMNNLCTVNKNAGQLVKVSSEIISLLDKSVEYYKITGGEINIMLGPVLKMWHECINDTHVVPEQSELEKAAGLCAIDGFEIDRESSSVRLVDARSSFDVGAIAKGFAVEKIAQFLRENNISGYVINAGGNVCLIGEKSKNKGWSVAIRNPQENGSSYAMIFELENTSCVTSGVYERNVVIDGVKYHHIIDKDTLQPAKYFDSVSVITEDSCYADALSTALFCMSYEDGLALVQKLEGVDAIWILKDGTKKYTEGVKNHER